MTKRVLITGANKGIGRATVAAALGADDEVYVFLGSRDVERGAAARNALLESQPDWADRVEVIQLDVSSDDSVKSAADGIASRFGSDPPPLYAIVNNAGIGLNSADTAGVLNVNTHGPRRVCETFLPLLDPERGRIVNVSSASGPMFVAGCARHRQRELTNPEITREELEELMNECVTIAEEGGSFDDAGFGDGRAYGLSKACLNAYTMILAREHPNLKINACTPGFIETDMTRHYAESRGVSPESMGMKSPEEGTRASIYLLLGDVEGSGWYFGSDAKRSPMDRYRSPGDPPYTGR